MDPTAMKIRAQISEVNAAAGMPVRAEVFIQVCHELHEAEAELERLRNVLLRVSAEHLPSCPVEAVYGTDPAKRFCQECCPYYPEILEFDYSDCWQRWKDIVGRRES